MFADTEPIEPDLRFQLDQLQQLLHARPTDYGAVSRRIESRSRKTIHTDFRGLNFSRIRA